ncbi:MAG: OmpA family protein [Acidobacteria bacterium]|nr:OmpA family protein [Acidobacteriota bacterium]
MYNYPEDEDEHRGGAWKVAYADFVTALMALFIVLWLMSAGESVRRAISSYFKDPRGSLHLKGTGHAGSGEGLAVTEKNVGALKHRLESALRELPEFRDLSRYILFSVTGEGLRIELQESNGGMFFEVGDSRPTRYGDVLFRALAMELAKLPNKLVIEGHTDARAYHSAGLGDYSNWNLSFDRANMARRIMIADGLGEERIAEVRGFADRRPITADPNERRNRRVSVVVAYAAR